MRSTELLRPLGSLESFFSWANAKFGAFTIAAVFRVSGHLDVEQLQRAVANTLTADPLLSSVIVGPASRAPGFHRVPVPIAIVDVLHRHSDCFWQQVLQENVNRPFACVDGNCGPLFGMTVLLGSGKHELVVRIHHSVCDGRGLLTLCNRILAAYERLRQSSDALHPEALEVARPVCGRVKIHRRLAATMCLLQSGAVDAFRGGSAGKLKSEGPEAECTGPTVTTCLSLTEQETSDFIQACRIEQTTVNAAIAAAGLQVAAQPGYLQAELSIQTNLDLRPRLSVPSSLETVGLCSYWESTRHAPGRADTFWELAREYRYALNAKADKYGVPPLGFAFIAKAFLSLSARSKQRGRTSDLMLSNLGLVEAQSVNQSLQVDEFFFATSQCGIGSRIGLTAATVQKRLCLTCLTLAPEAPLRGQKFLQDLRHAIAVRPTGE